MSRVIAAAAVRFRFYILEVQCMADPVVRVLDFEGPLDLLIHLIEKNKMDIYDIPIVSITDQYIEYLHSLTEMDLEAASQFLVMASLLLQIKSRMLLPKPPKEAEEEAREPKTLDGSGWEPYRPEEKLTVAPVPKPMENLTVSAEDLKKAMEEPAEESLKRPVVALEDDFKIYGLKTRIGDFQAAGGRLCWHKTENEMVSMPVILPPEETYR